MSATIDYYLDRAAENAKAAQETNLVNVRERCLRAEAAWRAMADRLIRVEEKKKNAEQAAAADKASRPATVEWPIAPFGRKLKRPD